MSKAIYINNCFDKGGNMIIHKLCKTGSLKEVKRAVKSGMYINIENDRRETPLFVACYNNRENIAVYLLNHNAKFTNKKIAYEDSYSDGITGKRYHYYNLSFLILYYNMKKVIKKIKKIDIEFYIKHLKNKKRPDTKYLESD